MENRVYVHHRPPIPLDEVHVEFEILSWQFPLREVIVLDDLIARREAKVLENR